MSYDEIVDIPYPESLVYLLIAVNGISPDGIYAIEEGNIDGGKILLRRDNR